MGIADETPQNPRPAGAEPSFRFEPRVCELAALADLWVASWQATMPGIDFGARREWLCAKIREIEARGGATICAFDPKDRLAGFLLLDVVSDVLEQIAVRPALFGSGLAVALLDEAKRLCPRGLSLEVNADNLRALRFYEKSGFARAEPAVNPNSGLKTWRMRWIGGDG